MLTWLGAGDIVESGTAGGNYGYALMWMVLLALFVRFFFVSLIAKYQLCNQHGEGVLDGLARLHPWFAPALMVIAILMGHFIGSYMVVGMGETWRDMTGVGTVFQWAAAWTALAVALTFRPKFQRIEIVFKIMLAVLSVSLIGIAVWSGPDPAKIVEGAFAFKMPPQQGPFDSMLLAIGLMGAIGGSVMNLAYPYFLEQKGWNSPEYRRVQMSDFLVGVVVMIVLNLAIWTTGAELIFNSGETISDLDGLTELLAKALGNTGRCMFLMGVFAAVFTSQLGNAVALGSMASHGYRRWKAGIGVSLGDHRDHTLYRAVALWVLISPLVWTFESMPGFVTLTVIVNSLQVVLLPLLAGGIWWITSAKQYIGSEYQNRWWQNIFMAAVFCLSLWGAWQAVASVAKEIGIIDAA